MRRRWLKFSTATAALVVLALTQGSAVAAVPTEGRSSAKPYTFAVIGDIPYGDAQIQHFPRSSTRSTLIPTWPLLITWVTSRAGPASAPTSISP